MNKIFRRNFLKICFSSLSILTIIKLDLFFPSLNKTKLKKRKNFVWYLNDKD
jgi:hypothetical protein